MKNKAFTLTEVMIVLTVIGILTAVLLPVAFKNMPDENVMKFKKGNATFNSVVRSLSESNQYFYNGDFSLTASGADISAIYFCEAFADNVAIKSKTCGGTKYNGSYQYVDSSSGIATIKTTVDTYCAAATASDNVIVTADDITFYEASPASHFALTWSVGGWLFKTHVHKDSNGFCRIYKVFCIDVDGIGTGEAPFGYGVRADGKILPGARADEWMEKSIQRE